MLRVQQSCLGGQASARQVAARPAAAVVRVRSGGATPTAAALDARAGSSLRCSTSRRGALTTTCSLVKRAEDVSTGAREKEARARHSSALNRFCCRCCEIRAIGQS